MSTEPQRGGRILFGRPGAAEQLHQCVDLTTATRDRVPAQRLRQVRMELRPWRSESFVADPDDHIHATLIRIEPFVGGPQAAGGIVRQRSIPASASG